MAMMMMVVVWLLYVYIRLQQTCGHIHGENNDGDRFLLIEVCNRHRYHSSRLKPTNSAGGIVLYSITLGKKYDKNTMKISEKPPLPL
jgi:hypothetical protein